MILHLLFLMTARSCWRPELVPPRSPLYLLGVFLVQDSHQLDQPEAPHGLRAKGSSLARWRSLLQRAWLPPWRVHCPCALPARVPGLAGVHSRCVWWFTFLCCLHPVIPRSLLFLCLNPRFQEVLANPGLSCSVRCVFVAEVWYGNDLCTQAGSALGGSALDHLVRGDHVSYSP